MNSLFIALLRLQGALWTMLNVIQLRLTAMMFLHWVAAIIFSCIFWVLFLTLAASKRNTSFIKVNSCFVLLFTQFSPVEVFMNTIDVPHICILIFSSVCKRLSEQESIVCVWVCVMRVTQWWSYCSLLAMTELCAQLGIKWGWAELLTSTLDL